MASRLAVQETFSAKPHRACVYTDLFKITLHAMAAMLKMMHITITKAYSDDGL